MLAKLWYNVKHFSYPEFYPLVDTASVSMIYVSLSTANQGQCQCTDCYYPYLPRTRRITCR